MKHYGTREGYTFLSCKKEKCSAGLRNERGIYVSKPYKMKGTIAGFDFYGN